MRLATIATLWACGGSRSEHAQLLPPPRPESDGVAAPHPHSLELEAVPGGRLVLERDGTAWDVHCDGAALTRRLWQGGALEPAGTCSLADGATPERDYFVDELAISGDRVARWSDKQPIRISVHGIEQRVIPVEGLSVASLAFDGDAVVAVVHRGGPGPPYTIAGTELPTALAAVVRIEGERVTTHELVAYGSRGPGVDPSFVAMGPDRMLLVSKTGGVVTCDYQLRCDPILSVPEIHDANGALRLADGSLVLYRYESGVARIDPRGRLDWSVPAHALDLVGATDREVWILSSEGGDQPARLHGLELGSGVDAGARGSLRTARREKSGRYLALVGIAPTPIGTVVRGMFGGRLESAGHTLTMAPLGAVCWWQNPHNGAEHAIALDGTCEPPFAKAILTERRYFVAIGAKALSQ